MRDEKLERKIKSNSLDHFRFMKLIRYPSAAVYEQLELKGEAVVGDIHLKINGIYRIMKAKELVNTNKV